MLRITACSVVGVSAFTSFNSPLAPGNWNLPTEQPAFGADLVKTLPDINVRFHYPHVDPTTLLAAAEDDMAIQQRLSALGHEMQFDREALQNLAGHSSFMRGPEDAVYNAANGVAVESTSASADSASEMMLGLSHAPHPTAHATSVASASGCARDYNSCPAGFASSPNGCTALSYSGICSAKNIDVSKMSLSSKIRFASQCGAPFPCASGPRNYAARCPQGWSNTNGSVCEAPADYSGACPSQDFSGFNAAMMAKWEQMCGAYWA